jgi:hypothetical protein
MQKVLDISSKLKNENGVTAVYVAILLVIFVGVAAFAIDVGYHRVVRNQLQNAADAAALAACNHFYPRNTPVTFPAPPPSWADASTEAASAITMNTADNKQVQVGTTVMGWWDITQAYPGSMSAPSTTYPPPSQNCGPAVSVTITKSAGQNDGPIVSFFGNIFGVQMTDMSATATAVAASPGSVRPGAVIPVAISEEVANQWQQHQTEATAVIIGSAYHYPNSQAGEWTTFMGGESSTTAVRNLIDTGNTVALNTNDSIYIQTGVHDTAYYSPSTNQYSIDSQYGSAVNGSDIFLPVVGGTILDATGQWRPITSFIGFHVICAGEGCDGRTATLYGGSTVTFHHDKVIYGYFTTGPTIGPLGPHYGPLDRCRLCQ